jgi:hypothetical protein
MTGAAERPSAFDVDRGEPRCRICRDESVRVLVNDLLDWHGVPLIGGPGKTQTFTYAAIFRHLEPLNEGRGKSDQITYASLWVHAKTHYEVARARARWRAQILEAVDKAFRDPGADAVE